MDEKFGKAYKLCSKIKINELFSEGKQLKQFPFVLRYKKTELNTTRSFQVVISVPKRKFKRAIDRNKIKRIIKEAIRKKKYILEQSEMFKEHQYSLFFIYTAHKELSYQKVNYKIEQLFLRLIEERY